MKKREAYRQKIEAKLDEWKAEIDRLKAKARQKQVDVETEYKEELNTLREKREELKRKLDKLEDASEDAWEDIKEGIEKSRKEMKTAFDKALKKFS